MILMSEGVLYKLSRTSLPAWDWMYSKLSISNQYTFREKCIIKFLFINACMNNNAKRVCAMYDNFEVHLSDKEIPLNALIKVRDSYLAIGETGIAGEVEKNISRRKNIN